jgi:hypothetical protein
METPSMTYLVQDPSRVEKIETAADLENSERFPLSFLLSAYNYMTRQTVRKFADRKSAVRRVWAELEKKGPVAEPAAPQPAPEPASEPEEAPPAPPAPGAQPPLQRDPTAKGTPKPRANRKDKVRVFKLPLGGPNNISPVRAAKAGSRREKVLEMLKAPGGATFDEISKAVKTMGGEPWNEIQTYQGIRLVNSQLGWRLATDATTGKITAHDK